MRALLVALLVPALLLTGCDGDDGAVEEPGSQEQEPGTAEERPTRPARGEIDVAVDPLTVAELPEAPDAGLGRAVLGEESFDFSVTFCADESPIGTGEAEGLTVAWDIREEDGDHRVSIIFSEEDRRWVRAGPAEVEWDPEARVLRFAGAFVPFQAEDGSQARQGGIVVVCPPREA